jgi:hypothetical protein
MNYRTRLRRNDDVKQRAGKQDSMSSYCRIIGCHQPATAGTEGGLNRRYCRKHEDHFERHGSYIKGSYRRADIEPHRKQALRWLKTNAHQPSVILAEAAVVRLYRQAGAKVEAFRLRGLKPEERAWVAWARLREAGVHPARPLAAWLAIVLTIHHDPQRETKKEFQRVQAAKLMHRMSSGSHKKWERQRSDGKLVTEKMHRYPHSRGRILRHLGEQLERVAEGLEASLLGEVLVT